MQYLKILKVIIKLNYSKLLGALRDMFLNVVIALFNHKLRIDKSTAGDLSEYFPRHEMQELCAKIGEEIKRSARGG